MLPHCFAHRLLVPCWAPCPWGSPSGVMMPGMLPAGVGRGGGFIVLPRRALPITSQEHFRCTNQVCQPASPLIPLLH